MAKQKKARDTTPELKNFIDRDKLRKISLFKNATNAKPIGEEGVFETLARFKSDKHKKAIEILRRILATDEARYEREKKRHPAVTFGGTFTDPRSKDTVKEPSGLMVLDWDDDIPDPEKFRDALKKHAFILSAFVSPSNRGVKAVAVVPKTKDPDEFKQIFNQVEAVLPGLDKSGKDISRLCFECWDPRLWINKKASCFKYKKQPDAKPKKSEPGEDAEKLKATIDLAVAKGKCIVKGYDNWLKVGFVIADLLGEDGREYFHKVSRLDPDEYEPKECDDQFDKCLKSEGQGVNLGTVIKYAKDAGVDINKAKLSSPSNETDKEWIKRHVFRIESVERSTKFAHVLVNDDNIAEYFESVGKKMSETLLARASMIGDLEKWPTSIKNDMLSDFDESKIQRDTADTGYLYFKNCTVKIRKGKPFEILSGEDRPLVWRKHIIDDNFTPTTKTHKIVEIAKLTSVDYNRLQLGIGYLLHRYWFRHATKIVWACDFNPQSRNDGRRGKDLLTTLAKFARDWTTLKWKPGHNFWTGPIKPDTAICHFEDVSNHLATDSEIKSVITGDLSLEHKGRDVRAIKFENKPKFSASSQLYPRDYADASIRGRIFLLEFTDYLQKHPLKETLIFGDKDKSPFYMWLIQCFELYMNNQNEFAGTPELTAEQREHCLKLKFGKDTVDAVEEVNGFFLMDEFLPGDDLAGFLGCSPQEGRKIARFKECFEALTEGVFLKRTREKKGERRWGYERVKTHSEKGREQEGIFNKKGKKP